MKYCQEISIAAIGRAVKPWMSNWYAMKKEAENENPHMASSATVSQGWLYVGGIQSHQHTKKTFKGLIEVRTLYIIVGGVHGGDEHKVATIGTGCFPSKSMFTCKWPIYCSPRLYRRLDNERIR
jgi:hypothetical protein